MNKPDTILLEVYRNRFEGIAEEMGTVLRRASFSANIKERLDYSCALFDTDGRMVAQAAHIPVHLGAMPASVRAALESRSEWGRGDIVLLNDPYAGGTHLPDLTMVSPVFAESSSVPAFFVASRAHHSDVGGMSPGSLPVSTELFQEGIILPPVLLVDSGNLNTSLLEVILRNVRTPEERRGDLAAQRAAHAAGTARLDRLMIEHGFEEVGLYAGFLQEYSEKRTRSMIRQWPDGAATFSDTLQIDAVEGTVILSIQARIEISGESVLFDFSGSSDAGPHAFNAVLPITQSACYYVVRFLSTDDIPVNDGCFSPVTVVAPSGTIVNAAFPSAVAAGNVETAQRIVDVLLGALAQILPDKVPAASQGTMNNVTMGPVDNSGGDPWVYYETIGGGMGAGPHGSGLSGLHVHMTNTMNTPIEAFEQAYPIQISRYALRKDSGGDGQQQGGCGAIREYTFEVPTRVTVQSTRRSTRPWGLNDGGDGKPGRNVRVNPNGDEHFLPGQFCLTFMPGEKLRIETPGGGGWGSAL